METISVTHHSCPGEPSGRNLPNEGPGYNQGVGMIAFVNKCRARLMIAIMKEDVKTRPLDVVLMGCWFGIVVGLVELAWIVSWQAFTGRITSDTLRTNWHFAWMIPISNFVLFGAIGVFLGLTAWLFPRARVNRIACYVFSFFASFVVVLGIPGLHLFALGSLSSGIAFQTAPWIAARPEGCRRLIRRTLPVGVFLVLALTGWQGYVVSRAEARALAASPPAAPGAPNVLLIVLDTVRADALSMYGSTRDTTPNLARIAQRAVRFDAARSTAPWTLPSHASLFTGRWAHELTLDAGLPLDTTFPTLAEYLAGRGYATAGFVANMFNCNSWYGLSRGFAHYEDFYENDSVSAIELLRASRFGRTILMSSPGQHVIKAVMTTPKYIYRKSAEMINRDALAWLPSRGNRPFFMLLNYYDAHDPYEPPAEAARPFSRPPEGGPPRDLMEQARNDYDNCLAYLDDQIGRLFDELGRRGDLENTVVIITADHGEGFGEHGLSGHGVSLYRPELHVPLLVISPTRVSKGTSIADPVSLRDIPTTVADLTGLASDSPFPGRSLSRYWESGTLLHDPVLSEVKGAPLNVPNLSRVPSRHGLMRSVADRQYVYVLNGDGREELYDRHSDPHEQHDLARSPKGNDPLIRLREILRNLTGDDSPST